MMAYDKSKEYDCELGHEPFVEELLKYKNGGNVLDLGTGTGRDALFLAQKGFNVTALDNDSVHLERLSNKIKTKNVQIDLVLSEIYTYQPTVKYDVIICGMVLHFLKPEKILEVISLMQKWTKPDGINIVTAYSDKNEPDKRPYLFKHNELSSYYADWQILDYDERPTGWFHINGEAEQRRNQAVYLIAQK